jgi:hypothetical protein
MPRHTTRRRSTTAAAQHTSPRTFFSVHVRSTTETSAVGTRKDMPVSLPLSSGMTLPTALAAPVLDGMMLKLAPRPPRQSFADGPSTVFCVAVTACTCKRQSQRGARHARSCAWVRGPLRGCSCVAAVVGKGECARVGW